MSFGSHPSGESSAAAPLSFPRSDRTVLGSDTLGINAATVNPQRNCRFHVHDYFELVLVWSGEGMHGTRDGEYRIREGNAFLVPPGVAHSYASADRLVLSNVYFDPVVVTATEPAFDELPGYHALFDIDPYLRARHVRSPQFRFPPDSLSGVRDAYRALEEEVTTRAPGYRFLAHSRFMTLIGLICRHHQNERTVASVDARILSRVAAFVRRNLATDVSLTRLSAIASVSPRTLQRVFRRQFAMSPMDYVARLRLAGAEHLLVSTDLPVALIASRCGYPDPNYFSRAFASAYGRSPRAHRRDRPERESAE